MDDLSRILSLLHTAENLKTELRHSWLSSGRQESVAEHTWRMCLMAVLLHKKLATPIDLEKTLTMIVIHDLVEAYAGDVPAFASDDRKEQKREQEEKAIEKIRDVLGDESGQDLHDLWHEFETRASHEAKVVHALDKLEVQLQHNEANLDTWLPIEKDMVYTAMDESCTCDAVLQELCQLIKEEGVEKMRAAGEDIAEIERRATPDAP